MTLRKAVVLGAGGFIGSHLVRRLKKEGYYVIGSDFSLPAYSPSLADVFHQGDLRNYDFVNTVIDWNADEVYQLAADMGGAGYIFTGDHDADVMYNSAQINLNVAKVAVEKKVKALFYSSSACIYPEYNQLDPQSPKCTESSAYPAEPDSEYGWEKLFSERLFLSFKKNYGLNVKIARYHNVYGPEGAWNNGKEKAPAAICRKVAEASAGGEIEIWGDGKQTRSFLFIEDCLDATIKLTRSEKTGPFNIGSEEMISINDFAMLIMQIAEKPLKIKNIVGPEGVRGRCSDNKLIKKELDWEPKFSLKEGIKFTFDWINNEVIKGFPSL